MKKTHRNWSLTLLLLFFALKLAATPMCKVTRYDENNGLSHWRVTQILQDQEGIIWFATWNGLNRFDGYEFKTFKVSQATNCVMTDDRIRNIWLSEEGDIYCKSDEGYYGFNPNDCSFYEIEGKDNDSLYNKLSRNNKAQNLNNPSNNHLPHTDGNGHQWTLTNSGQLYHHDKATHEMRPYPLDVPMKELRFGYSDNQGNLWVIFTGGVYKLTFTDNSITHLPQEHDTHVRCIFVDNKNRYWVSGCDKHSLRLYSADNRLLGYLGNDGRLHKQYTHFAGGIYCITQSSTGTLWMGSKPDGLFRLNETDDGRFSIQQFKHNPENPYSLSHNSIYDIKEDRQGRLWIATLGGGINCLPNPESGHPRFVHKGNEMKSYPAMQSHKVRNLLLTGKDIMLAATTEGLLVTQLPEEGQYGNMRFHHHTKLPDLPTSLGCNATMALLEDSRGSIFVCTEFGGISQILDTNLLADTLHFRHFNTKNGLPSDVVLTMTEHEGLLWLVCINQITVLNPYDEVISCFDANFFQHHYRFSEAHPRQLPDGRWMFGLYDGAFTLDTERLRKSDYVPPLIVTSMIRQGEEQDLGITHRDTLTLQPHQRNLTVKFAAIDYTHAEPINYTFRLTRDNHTDSNWNKIGKNRSATFLDMQPGEYVLEISSTNADGVWVDNTLTIDIHVVPTFWETKWAIALYIVIILTILGGVLYTHLYIKRINQRQRETLEAYLTLLNKPTTDTPNFPEGTTNVEEKTTPQMSKEDDRFMRNVMDFIEAHLSEADLNIGDMADAVATSRSSLNRKLKSTLGVTPVDLLREARIKRACQLLETSGLNVSEVAYRCGFADPKYFSRCFKQTIGVSPTEYKRK